MSPMLSNYELIQTADGSFSLRGPEGEIMHHRQGALGETQMIYGDLLRWRMTLGGAPSVLVVGLGMAYIEMITVQEALAQGRDQELRMTSYESDDFLRESFRDWLRGICSSEMKEFYQKILEQVVQSGNSQVSCASLQKGLAEIYAQGRWQLEGALGQEVSIPSHGDCICYDAYSSKSTPELWTEEFLQSFLAQLKEAQVLFSSYACTGVLRRSLMDGGFRVAKRPGFAGKRNSTVAFRGVLPEATPLWLPQKIYVHTQ